MVYFYVHINPSFLSWADIFLSFNKAVGLGKILPVLNPLQPSGYFSNTRYKILKKFYVLTPKRVYVFCTDLVRSRDYFSVNTTLTGLRSFFQTECVYCALRDQVRGENLPSCLNVICMQNVWVGGGGGHFSTVMPRSLLFPVVHNRVWSVFTPWLMGRHVSIARIVEKLI
jgi:hypothetical protein